MYFQYVAALTATTSDIDLSKVNLTMLKLFHPDIVQTTKQKIDSTTNRDFNEWFSRTINEDIDLMMRAANHMITKNQRIYGDILHQSPAAPEKKASLTQQIDGIMIQTSNEIAAETLKAHRLLFNYQSIIASYEKFSFESFRRNGLMHTETVIGGVQNILTHLFGTLNIFSSVAIATLDSETKAVIEGRPTQFEMTPVPNRRLVKHEIDGIESTEKKDTRASPVIAPTSAEAPLPPVDEDKLKSADDKNDINAVPSQDVDVIEI